MNIEVKVITRAKRKEITREDGALKVKLLSVPRDGKANQELTEYLADVFCVRKTDVTIVKGEKDKRKVVSLVMDEAEYSRKMAEIQEKA
ncbi:MAG TPA: DUF167 domain-containing protein [Syntrophorhabdaceae bacterium]|jgi:hypothetical protein